MALVFKKLPVALPDGCLQPSMFMCMSGYIFSAHRTVKPCLAPLVYAQITYQQLFSFALG